MTIFNPKFDYRIAAADTLNIAGVSEAQSRQARRDILSVMTAYGRYGEGVGDSYYTKEGYLQEPLRWGKHIASFMDQIKTEEALEMAKFLTKEQSIGTGSVPDSFFTRGPIIKGTPEYTADLWFLQVMPSEQMTMEVETREEWDMNVEFVRIDTEGQVKFAKFTGATTTMENHEYGAGIDCRWTWLETNVFAIKMNRLAPKFRYHYFNQMSDRTTTAFLAAAVAHGATTYGTSLIRTYNGIVTTMQRATRTFTGPQQGGINQTQTYNPWATAAPVVIIPPEQLWMWKAALGARYVMNYIEEVGTTPQVVVTTKLTNPNIFYVVPRGWEQNEYATRVPIQAHGPVDNIRTFSQEMTYRGAYGVNWDSNSVYSCDISSIPSGQTFQIGETNI